MDTSQNASAGSQFDVVNGVVYVPEKEQDRLHTAAQIDCLKQQMHGAEHTPPGYCPMNWDNIMCWPAVPPGTEKYLNCPNYINRFNISAPETDHNLPLHTNIHNGTFYLVPIAYASKTCLEDGTWYVSPLTNRTWTDFSQCSTPPVPTHLPSIFTDHVWRIKWIYNVGYAWSLTSLILAIAIMLFFKKLHCPRNTVHIHLFVSFSLRAALSLLKDNLFVEGLGLPHDVKPSASGKLEFTDRSHWECKLLVTLFNYALGANYMWIFVEGLYLHVLIFVSVFSERSSIAWYILLGWASPVLFVLLWALVRTFAEDVYCWNTHPTKEYFWIIKGPIVITICINFMFFINIVRVLFTKLKASNSPEARKYRYRKLAKSTLVLIPLFGIHYVIFLGIPEEFGNETMELVKLYFEMSLNSFQGFLVALLFCFMNGEVQSEIRKKWHRYKLRRSGSSLKVPNRSTWNTVSTYMTRARNSFYTIHSTVDKADSFQLSTHNCEDSPPKGSSAGNGCSIESIKENNTKAMDYSKNSSEYQPIIETQESGL